MPGQGGSGRPELSPGLFHDYQSTVSFFVTRIRQYIDISLVKSGILSYNQGIYLLAHSMGAIFATNFAIEYPELVLGLILMSPAGVAPRPVDHIPNESSDPVQNFSTTATYGKTWAENTWSSCTLTPADFYRMLGYYFSYVWLHNEFRISRVNSDSVFTSP